MTPADTVNGIAPLTLIVITLGYAATCVIWPFKTCRTCCGTGRLHSPFLRAVRLCPPCRGTGLRLRAGRRAWNTYRRLTRDTRRNRHR